MCYGFKLVGDNLDKTIKPRDMRVDNSSQSLHYFNIYSVLDRIDFRSLSCDTSVLDMAEVDTNQFLPSASDMEAITANLGTDIQTISQVHTSSK